MQNLRPSEKNEHEEILNYNENLKTKAVEDFPYKIYGNRIVAAPFKCHQYTETGMKVVAQDTYQDKDNYKIKAKTIEDPRQLKGVLVAIGEGVSEEFKEFFSVGDTILLPSQLQPMIVDRRYHPSSGIRDEIFYVQCNASMVEGKDDRGLV